MLRPESACVQFIKQSFDPIQNAFFSLFARIPQPLQPYVPTLLIVAGVLLYLWALNLLGRWAQSKGQRFWLGVSLGLITGPVLGALFIAFLNDAAKTPSKTTRRRRTRRR